jgi:hypothetical protein
MHVEWRRTRIMPLNPTKNQHYISQAEQRLNAIDPSSPKRMFALEVVDRDKHLLRARDPRGSSIETSLSYHDLFSLDVISPNVRNNLEDLFQRYEKDVSAHSQALLAKLDVGNEDLKKEVINLFCAKLMNFLRNPFCIRKALNTFGSVAIYHFTDRALATELAAAIKGSRPQRDGVCARFNIASDEYDRWLKVLFLLLTKAPGQPLNILEDVVKGLLESNYTMVTVAEETGTDPNRIFLLSDRGINTFPINLSANGLGEALSLEFNVSARACMSFTLVDPTPLLTSGRLSMLAMDEMLRAKVKVNHVRNNREFLVSYNRRTISHCAETVFSASEQPAVA